jgi:hypothetical protein
MSINKKESFHLANGRSFVGKKVITGSSISSSFVFRLKEPEMMHVRQIDFDNYFICLKPILKKLLKEAFESDSSNYIGKVFGLNLSLSINSVHPSGLTFQDVNSIQLLLNSDPSSLFHIACEGFAFEDIDMKDDK